MKPELLDLVLKKMMFENDLIDFSQILTLLNVFHPHVHKKMSVSSLTRLQSGRGTSHSADLYQEPILMDA